MAGIRSKNTKPELIVRKYLHSAGLRYRLHVRNLPGNPDIFLPRYKAVVQVRGCFWHQHAGCKLAYMPKANHAFWNNKLSENVKRDTAKDALLTQLGLRVFVVWECQLKPAQLAELADSIRSYEDCADRG
jgi:DNA mismatch endonuclease, patch repair protein